MWMTVLEQNHNVEKFHFACLSQRGHSHQSDTDAQELDIINDAGSRRPLFAAATHSRIHARGASICPKKMANVCLSEL
jgi:hypothetical protein